MYDWLNGPGAKLRNPLPSSTNYLGAYDKYGNLIRASDQAQSKRRRDVEEASSSEDGGLEARIEPEVEAQDEDALPPESREDLQPFPLNRHFYSQPVLSEELREKIYDEVVVRNTPISVVSSSYKVTMERAAAVVRLKTIEKQWEAQVSIIPFYFLQHHHRRSNDESTPKSISLEDTHKNMVTKQLCEPL